MAREGENIFHKREKSSFSLKFQQPHSILPIVYATYIGPLCVGEDAVVVVTPQVAVERGGPAQGLHPPEEAVQRPPGDHCLAHTHTVVEESIGGWDGDVLLWRLAQWRQYFRGIGVSVTTEYEGF